MTGQVPRISRYLRTRKRGNSVAIFHELHPDPLYCSVGEWDEFLQDAQGQGGTWLFRELEHRKLIVLSNDDDQREFNAVAEWLERKFSQPLILYLMLAQGCNFACRYCPIPDMARQYGETFLRAEDAFASIELWLTHIWDRYDPSATYFIIFYGGEPLLNKAVFQEVVCSTGERRATGQIPENIALLLSTNGALIDREIALFCRAHSVSVVVGIDGPPEDHDSFRVDQEGRATAAPVLSAIQILVEHGVRTFGSVSVTPRNVDHLDRLISFFSQLGIEKIGFNILRGRRLRDCLGAADQQEYYRAAVRAIIASTRHAPCAGYEFQVEKKHAAFARRDFFPFDCTCYGTQLVIQPDGCISNCPFFKTTLGHVRSVGQDFRIWNTPIVTEWRQRLPLYHDAYSGMDAKSLCGGGCAWGSYELTGDPLAVDEASKIFAEEIFDELLWSECDTS